MRQMVDGRVVEVSTRSDGSVQSGALRQAAGIPDDRQLVLQLPDGSNRIINPGEDVNLPPDQFFTEIPAHKRGFVPAGRRNQPPFGI